MNIYGFIFKINPHPRAITVFKVAAQSLDQGSNSLPFNSGGCRFLKDGLQCFSLPIVQ